ncbi:hypothetical protein MTO96_030621 [Rhipicephalus appendiculatus]
MEASIEGLQGELRAEREQRSELQKQLGASREREEATASLVEKMEGDLRKEREGRAELEERVKELMTLCPGPERCEAEGVGSADSQEKTGGKGDQGGRNGWPQHGGSEKLQLGGAANHIREGTVMFASKVTMESLGVILTSVLDIIRDLLSEGAQYVLTGKLNQDPLERFFGITRSFGGGEDHPTIVSFSHIYRF